MAKPLVEREPRFRVPQATTVNVEIIRLDCQAMPTSAGTLVDLARGGAKLLLEGPLPLDDLVELRLLSEPLELDVRITAAVCWCQPEGDKWALGCRFVPALPQESLERLFVTGLLERRFFKRSPLRLEVQAQWEMEAGFLPAMLWDLSDGGFCLLMPTPRKMGGRVLVAAGDAMQSVTVPAKVQWEMHLGGGYLVGCQFINRQGYEALCSLPAIGKHGASGAAKDGEKRTVKERLRGLVGAFFPTTPAEEPETQRA